MEILRFLRCRKAGVSYWLVRLVLALVLLLVLIFIISQASASNFAFLDWLKDWM